MNDYDDFEEEEVSKCFRCNIELPESELRYKHGESYCDCCYDDMFVSWNDVFGGKKC